MSIWNPYIFTPTGQPRGVTTPAQLRVSGPRLSADQNVAAQRVFAAFCERARLSVVQNPVESGVLSDNSQYRIEVIGGVSTMTVWPAELNKRMVVFGGVYRSNSSGSYFKENYTSNYGDSSKIIPDGDLENIGNWFWNELTPALSGSLSGPAAKFRQFARGAVHVFAQYIRDSQLYIQRSLGDGLFILPDENNVKQVYFYKLDGSGNIRYAKANLIPYNEIKAAGARIPDSIKNLFPSGLPIPPAPEELSSGKILVSQSAIRTNAGVSNSSSVGAMANFPTFASSNSGLEVYFGVIERIPYPGPTNPVMAYTALLRMNVSMGKDGPVASLTVVISRALSAHYGNFVDESVIQLGVFYSFYGVTYYNGKLLIFRKELVIDEYLYAQSVVLRLAVKTTISWSGALVGEVVTQQVETYSSYSGSVKGTRSISPSKEYELETDFDIMYFRQWTLSVDISVSINHTVEAQKNRGSITFFNVEGVFMIHLIDVSGYSPLLVNVSGSVRDRLAAEDLYLQIVKGTGEVRTWPTTDPEMQSDNYDNEYVYGHPQGYKYGLDTKWKNTPAPAIGTVPSAIFSFYKSYINEKGGMFNGDFDVEGSIEYEEPVYTYHGTKLYADGIVIDVPVEEILDKYEGSDYSKEKMSEDHILVLNPLAYVRTENKGINYGLNTLEVHNSQLGGKQVLLSLDGYVRSKGGYEPYALTKGTLINTALDRNFPDTRRALFVGELQP